MYKESNYRVKVHRVPHSPPQRHIEKIFASLYLSWTSVPFQWFSVSRSNGVLFWIRTDDERGALQCRRFDTITESTWTTV